MPLFLHPKIPHHSLAFFQHTQFAITARRPRVPAMPPAVPAPSSALIPSVIGEEKEELEALLKHKLRGIPKNDILDIKLNDILRATTKTRLANMPLDINLAFLLRNRALIDECGGTPMKEDTRQTVDVCRAIWFWRLDTVRQFQRWHDGVRWNIAIFTALLSQHYAHPPDQRTAESQHHDRGAGARIDSPRPTNVDVERGRLTPAAVRFMTLYLSAVLEQHTTSSSSPSHSSSFAKRESFIRLWRTSTYDLFTIHKSWARKALQRALKRLSREWEKELELARRRIDRYEWEQRVEPLVGSLVPGIAATRTRKDSSCHPRPGGEEMEVAERLESGGVEGEGKQLLDALRTPCPVEEPGDMQKGMVYDDERIVVCDLRTAISAVQSIRPRDMLPLLMRLFPTVRDQ